MRIVRPPPRIRYEPRLKRTLCSCRCDSYSVQLSSGMVGKKLHRSNSSIPSDSWVISISPTRITLLAMLASDSGMCCRSAAVCRDSTTPGSIALRDRPPAPGSSAGDRREVTSVWVELAGLYANVSARHVTPEWCALQAVAGLGPRRPRRAYELRSGAMLSREDNELLCRVGPGTPMGDLMRQYWVPAALSGALPARDLEPTMLADSSVQIYQRECNWVQALEGDIDTCHTVFLHLGSVGVNEVASGTWAHHALSDRAPRYAVADMDFGVMYGAYRPAEADTEYWRIANFLFPFYAMVPTGVMGLEVRVRAWVPMDDEHTLAISIARSAQGTRTAGRQVVRPPETRPNTTDWYGRFRCVANQGNDYLIDRAAQKTTSYTGIDSIFLQDQAATQRIGPIYDRTNEDLGTSDQMIIRTRKRLIDAARALRDTGKVPPGVDDPGVYGVRARGAVLPRGADWIEATRALRKAGVEHPGLTRAVLGGLPAV